MRVMPADRAGILIGLERGAHLVARVEARDSRHVEELRRAAAPSRLAIEPSLSSAA